MRIKSTMPVTAAISYQGRAYEPRPGYAVLEAGTHTKQSFLVVPVPLLDRLSNKHVGAGLAVTFPEAVRQGFVTEVEVDGTVWYEGAPILDEYIT